MGYHELMLGKRVAQLEEKLRELGVCPDCLTVPDFDGTEPFSHCLCGTGEDYGSRPLQRLQRLEKTKASQWESTT